MGALGAPYPLFQQAWLVNDIEKAIKYWHDTFGAGPFSVTEHHKCDEFWYRGSNQEADVSYAFGYLGDTMLQFIVQHDDTPSIYRDMYKSGQEGYHHLAYLVKEDEFQAERQRLIDLGLEPACELFADGVHASYFDTRHINGGFTEIHGDPPRILQVFAQWRRAHEVWRPGDSLIWNRKQGQRSA
ncbi:MAG: VOC family protein [Ilumatobacteraceae bacterium]|jgi:uncharacterized glyoxalase superfamily protein PhnB